MPREDEIVSTHDESFGSILERALEQENIYTGESLRQREASPNDRSGTYTSDDDKFNQLLDMKLKEEQEKLERQGIPAVDGVPVVPIRKPLTFTGSNDNGGSSAASAVRRRAKSANLSSSNVPKSASSSLRASSAEKENVAEERSETVDAAAPPVAVNAAVDDSATSKGGMKTPRRAGRKRKAVTATPQVGAKTAISSKISGDVTNTTLLGRVGFSGSMDPRQLRENNRRLAQELNRLKTDTRMLIDNYSQERQDMQDEIVRLRQLTGHKDDEVRVLVKKRVEKALSSHNGALKDVAMILSNEMLTKLLCSVTFVNENFSKLQADFEPWVSFFGDNCDRVVKLNDLIGNAAKLTSDHKEMLGQFLEKLQDAQLNLQLALEDDVDFLSSSAMPSILHPLNASTLHHDVSRLQQIIKDKTDPPTQRRLKLPWEESVETGMAATSEADRLAVAEGSVAPPKLSQVMEEEETKRCSSVVFRRQSSSVPNRSSILSQPLQQQQQKRESGGNEDGARRSRSGSRNSRRESIILSPSGLGSGVFARSPRVMQLQSEESGTPHNKSTRSMTDLETPSLQTSSPDLLNKALESPVLSDFELDDKNEAQKAIDLFFDLGDGVAAADATNTEPDDMELTESAPGTESPIGKMAPSQSDVAFLVPTLTDQRRSSFIRLNPTPPEEEPVKTSSGNRSLSNAALHIDPAFHRVDSPLARQTQDEISPPVATASGSKAFFARSSRSSEISAEKKLDRSESTMPESAPSQKPAPAKTEPKRKEGGKIKATAKTGSTKPGEVDIEIYKKMVVGQKSKTTGRSKKRKMSKAAEDEIRASADAKAKAKPREYAAFDATARFGEDLSFLDNSHVPSLQEFKEKKQQQQSQKHPLQTSNSHRDPEISKAAKEAPVRLPSRGATKDADSQEEDFLSLATDEFRKAESPRKRRHKKSVVYQDTDDSDDALETKEKKTKGKPSDEDVTFTIDSKTTKRIKPKKKTEAKATHLHAPKPMTNPTPASEPVLTLVRNKSVSSGAEDFLSAATTKKRTSSRYVTANSGSESDVVVVESSPDEAGRGSRRARSNKNYAEPKLSSKMRR